MTFSIESILFNAVNLPGEQIRIALSLIGLAITSYFDIFNKRNISTNLLYGFMLISFALNIIFYNENIFIFSLLISIPIALFGYLFYKMGQIGGADVLVLLSINFAVPIHPSISQLTFNFPFIASLFVFSGVVFALYFLISFVVKLHKSVAKPNMLPFLSFIPYLILAYFYINSPIYSPVYFLFITIMLLSSIFFLAYKNDIYKLQSQKIPIKDVDEEDVLAIELMESDFIKKYNLKRLITKSELERIKKLKIRELLVYTKLPPFLPFLFIGFIIALFFSKYLLLFQ